MLRLFDYGPSGNCYKVRLLLAHLGLPYETVAVDVPGGEGRRDEFRRAKNPHGRVPVLELEDGTALAESGAILAYLADGTPYLPESLIDRTRVLQWMFFEQNAVEPSIAVVRYWLSIVRQPQRLPGLETRQAAGREALEAMERHLAGGTRFFAGDGYTIADIALYGYSHVAGEAGIDLAPFPGVHAWFERVRARPGHVPMNPDRP